jgi:YegS/Rv2252/BmrU family lipid kinase
VADGSDLVLVLGGDGTINEVVQGLTFSNVPMGVLPGGTANVLAMELGLGSKLERAAERLGSCTPVDIALGRIAGASGTRCFLMMCGAGLDAQIVTQVNSRLKARTGKFAYWVAGMKQFIGTVPPVKVASNGETYTCGFALISRVRNYGGDLEIASGASLLRDEFEVVLFEGSNPLRYAWYMLGVGLKRVQKMRGVRTISARGVEIHTASPTQIDGEFFGREPVKIEIMDRALKLLMPPAYG